jgi:YgiT-type zinc finger domain-containing protein
LEFVKRKRMGSHPGRKEEELMDFAAHCPACGETCEEKVITLALPRTGTGLAVFKNVPAEVCRQCGEPRFSLKTTGRLMAVVRGDGPPDAVAQIPVFDLGRVG